MHFPTLPELLSIQGLIGSVIDAAAPALALCLANMLVINPTIGPLKTFACLSPGIVMAMLKG